MEPVKGGSLVQVPQDIKTQLQHLDNLLSIASWAIRFAANLKNVRVVLSGMSNLEQLNDNISYMKKFKPLTQEENDFLIKLGDQIRTSIAIPCTACNYCTPGCPEHICIPEYFNLFNKRKQNLSKGKSTEYDDLKKDLDQKKQQLQLYRLQNQRLIQLKDLKQQFQDLKKQENDYQELNKTVDTLKKAQETNYLYISYRTISIFSYNLL